MADISLNQDHCVKKKGSWNVVILKCCVSMRSKGGQCFSCLFLPFCLLCLKVNNFAIRHDVEMWRTPAGGNHQRNLSALILGSLGTPEIKLQIQWWFYLYSSWIHSDFYGGQMICGKWSGNQKINRNSLATKMLTFCLSRLWLFLVISPNDFRPVDLDFRPVHLFLVDKAQVAFAHHHDAPKKSLVYGTISDPLVSRNPQKSQKETPLLSLFGSLCFMMSMMCTYPNIDQIETPSPQHGGPCLFGVTKNITGDWGPSSQRCSMALCWETIRLNIIATNMGTVYGYTMEYHLI